MADAKMSPPPAEVIDHTARHEAGLAHQRVDDHEKACAERWEQTHKSIDGLREEWNARWGRLMWTLIGTLLATIATLATMLYDRL